MTVPQPNLGRSQAMRSKLKALGQDDVVADLFASILDSPDDALEHGVDATVGGTPHDTEHLRQSPGDPAHPEVSPFPSTPSRPAPLPQLHLPAAVQRDPLSPEELAEERALLSERSPNTSRSQRLDRLLSLRWQMKETQDAVENSCHSLQSLDSRLKIANKVYD